MKPLPHSEPTISVGILTAPAVTLLPVKGYEQDGCELRFTPADCPVTLTPLCNRAEAVIEVRDVVIGIGFHWERKENQRFAGSIRLVDNHDGTLTVINDVPLETYLASVISSEMSATASDALLRTHAIISRSWLMFQIYGSKAEGEVTDTPERLIRWYDREAHSKFDVCADDHCQRYQGVTRQTTPAVARAVRATAGIALTHAGQVCDARFSKCCGGVTELFSSCWQPVDYPYLQAVEDKWCAEADDETLAQVLNGYDRETRDWLDWRVEYTPTELRDIVRERTGIDYGDILSIEPLKRGPSGRIIELRLTGSLRSRIIGKELEIRRTFSRSHLYSSAFDVTRDDAGNFIFTGRGWGHGVGLCQIGAAVMGAKGFDHTDILSHYFPGATLTKLYNIDNQALWNDQEK